MDDSLLQKQTAAIINAYAAGMLVEPAAFASGEITFVERKADAVWPYVALAVTVPGGSVLSVAPGLIPLAESVRPHVHYRATVPDFLAHFANHIREGGGTASTTSQSICFALRTVPEAPALPAGLRFELKDADWMNAQQPARRFENGVGEVGVAGRSFRNRWGIAVVDGNDEPLAVAGVFDTFGLDEIGVDVLRARRGERIGAAVVAAATREILDRGGTPFYGCGASNIRSQRTAMSTGYVPVLTDASVN